MPRKNKYTPRADGRYFTNVSTGKYGADGRQIRIPLYGETSAELERKVEELRVELRQGTYINDKDTPLGKYATDWLETYKATRAKNTQAMYRNIIDKHIIPEIGLIRIGLIAPSHIQGLINSRSDWPRTCEQILMTSRQIFESAINDELVVKNPCRGIDLPKRPKSRKRALYDTEKDVIKSAARPRSGLSWLSCIIADCDAGWRPDVEIKLSALLGIDHLENECNCRRGRESPGNI